MYASRDELEVLEYWGKKQIFKKLQEKNKGKKKKYGNNQLTDSLQIID